MFNGSSFSGVTVIILNRGAYLFQPHIHISYIFFIVRSHISKLFILLAALSTFLLLCLCVSGLILHEEHIELLSEDFKALKKEVEGKVLQEGTMHFTGKETDFTRVECSIRYTHTSR